MIKANAQTERGNLLASVLAGSWRRDANVSDCSTEELELIRPLLIETGAAALAWRRIRHNPSLNSTSLAQELHDTYRLYKLLAAVYAREVAETFHLLRSHDIEPVMVKGWAVARHYAEPDTRPCGDIDLCVRLEQHARAREVLKSRSNFAHDVDLHTEFRRLDDRSFDELWSRTELLELEGEQIRVLCAEDHLRVLCYHFLREGGWRPLWLCDISAALEARPAGFDWDLCLGVENAVADWVICTIGLAHSLLGADLSDTPASVRDAKLPRWLEPGILREWESRSFHKRQQTPILGAARDPVRTLRGLRYHWPTPVEATIMTGGPFNRLPRFPFQAANFLSRTALLLRRSALRALRR